MSKFILQPPRLQLSIETLDMIRDSLPEGKELTDGLIKEIIVLLETVADTAFKDGRQYEHNTVAACNNTVPQIEYK